jgi:cell division protein FtsQ
LQRLTVADLSGSLGVLGDSVILVDSKELEQTLQALYPELTDVDIRVSLPGALTITATERQPVLAWTQDDAELWIDADGVSFLPRGNPISTLVRVKAQTAPPGSLPVQAEVSDASSLEDVLSTAPVSTAPQLHLDPDLVATILALNTIIPPDTVLLYNAEHGLGWNDKQHGWKVFFGSETQNIDQKLLVYQAMAARLEADGIQPELISVEFLHAPYYRMER